MLERLIRRFIHLVKSFLRRLTEKGDALFSKRPATPVELAGKIRVEQPEAGAARDVADLHRTADKLIDSWGKDPIRRREPR